jgi:DNA-binding transcriptional LysR family regulator
MMGCDNIGWPVRIYENSCQLSPSPTRLANLKETTYIVNVVLKDINSMDSRFIKSLLAVVEAGSFAGAARAEHLTAAAVAQRVRSLEMQLDTSLIVRTGHCVAPTPACLSILPRLRQITVDLGQIVADLDPTGLSGEVRIGAISTALSDRMPEILAGFSMNAPKASLRIIPGTSEELFAKLVQAEIDAAFVIRPPFSIPKTLELISLELQSFVMIVHAHDERSAHDIITAERALIYDASSWGGKLVMPWLRERIAPENMLCELDALETIAAAVGEGIGYAVVPEWHGLAKLDTVRRIPLPEVDARRELVLLHRRLSPAIMSLLNAKFD